MLVNIPQHTGYLLQQRKSSESLPNSLSELSPNWLLNMAENRIAIELPANPEDAHFPSNFR